MEIKAIETVYNGYRFRSRLEARWAVFFDTLGIKYEYEPEGFQLPSGKMYLPDFRVKCWGCRGDIYDKPFDLYIEVKGRMTQYDADRIKEFSRANANDECSKIVHPVLVVSSIPGEGCSHDHDSLNCYNGMDGTDVPCFNYFLIDGDWFGAYPAALFNKFYLWGDDSNYLGTSEGEKSVEAAYRIARQARFEHGETPTTAVTLYRANEQKHKIDRLYALSDELEAKFIETADKNGWDYCDNGPYNLCNYKEIRIVCEKFFVDNGYPKDEYVYFSSGNIRDHFYKRRFEVIRKLRMSGWSDDKIQEVYHFSWKQLNKTDEVMNLYLNK